MARPEGAIEGWFQSSFTGGFIISGRSFTAIIGDLAGY